MKNILNNLKTYLIAFAVMLAITAGTWLYVGSLMENLNKIKPDKGSAFSLASPKTYDQPLLIKLADFAFSISPLGASAAEAQTENNIIKYINAYPNTDIVQTRSFAKIKEDIILKSPGHPNIFEYQIDLAPYDFIKDEQGSLIFYEKGRSGDEAYRRFAIPAPFLIDADGKKSSIREVGFELESNGRLTLRPSADWLKQAKYPVILDPTVEITVLNVHSHPTQGQNWTVDFTTQGTADLKIIPNDQATIDDDEFVSLSCAGEIRTPRILAGEVIYYPNWFCDKIATVIHYTKTAGNHTLRFEFGGQIAYAYNAAPSTVVFRAPLGGATGGSTWTTPALMNGSSAVASMLAVTVNSAGTFVAVGYNSSNYPVYATSPFSPIIFRAPIIQTCSASTACGSSCTYNGDVYSTILMSATYGSGCWFKENLNTTKKPDGVTPITRYCYGSANGCTSPWGGLYDWDTAMNGATTAVACGEKIQGICPSGWHIPSDYDSPNCPTDDFQALGSDGGALKHTGIPPWNSPNTGATNASGWTGYPAGRYFGGSFFNRGSNGYSWSSTQKTASNAYYRYLNYDDAAFNRSYSYSKLNGFSVRCVKDDATTGTITSGVVRSGPVPPIIFRAPVIQTCSANTACGTECSFGGFVYGSVDVSGQCFMDRNLGADRVATAYNDSASYGYYYQWGRASDGHQIVSPQMSSTTPVNSSTDIPDHNRFILEPNSPWDWRDPQSPNETTLWAGANGGINNPCPAGWHVPLQTEWDSVMINLGLKTCTSNCLVGMATSTLKLSAAGYRNFSTGAFSNRDAYGFYWSGSPLVFFFNYGKSLIFSSTYVDPDDIEFRANAVAVRCLKD
ncbi:MAG: FISUMP domain-containing protein [bacterium]|nr:FISUMP domain-containing protein [bacterium]